MNRDEHLFIKLMEECAEVQQRTSKLLQFGPNETEPGMLFNNSQRLRAELDDLQVVIALLEEAFLIPHTSPESAAIYLKHKREKIAKYRAYSEKLGLVAESPEILPADYQTNNPQPQPCPPQLEGKMPVQDHGPRVDTRSDLGLGDLRPSIYAASRASVPERPAMWRALRAQGANIISSWIDEAGPGETADLGELWERIYWEISRCTQFVLYVEAGDFPLKGALVEVGMAIGLGKPIAIVAPGMDFDPPSYRPIGSWVKHPAVRFVKDIKRACIFGRHAAASQEAERGTEEKK